MSETNKSKDEWIEGILGTDDHAAMSKLSAVKRGYYSDPFIRYFAHLKAPFFPLMNRGTHARVFFCEILISKFLEASKGFPAQIVQLGGGSDTTYWRLGLNNESIYKYIELDLKENVLKKGRVLLKYRTKLFPSSVKPSSINGSIGPSLWLNNYALITADISDISQVSTALELAGIEKTRPTLFISECSLCYLEWENSDTLLKWITDQFPQSSVGIYEPIGPNDTFGRMMVRNLTENGIRIASLEKYSTVKSQDERMKSVGFEIVDSRDMLELYERVMPIKIRTTTSRIEIVDDYDEWKAIMTHYVFCIGSKGGLNLTWN